MLIGTVKARESPLPDTCVDLGLCNPKVLRCTTLILGVDNTSLIALLVAAVRARIGRWDVIEGALSDTSRTIRLIAIILATAIPSGTMALLIDLLARH